MMAQYVSDITALSSKGQVVLPKSIRENLQLEAGVKFMVISDGLNILLKPIEQPDMKEFDRLLDASQKWAEENGLAESDIQDAIKKVRRRKKAGV